MYGMGSVEISPVLGLGGAFQKGLVFLLNLAWNSRFRLPVLITVGFMVLDVRMQLEINVDIEVRHMPALDDDDEEEEEEEDDDDDDDDDYVDDYEDDNAEEDNDNVIENPENSDRSESVENKKEQ